jgi:hypothetical protein
MKIEERIFKILDIDTDIIVEVVGKQKDILDCMNEYIENMEYDWFDASDDAYMILYKDGSTEYIHEDYDGHKIRRKGIEAIVNNNPCTSVVYGHFSINQYGVVTPSEVEEINENIREIGK